MPREFVRRMNGKMLAAALIGGLVAWFGIIGYVFLDSRQRIDRTETALVALCALRADLDRRIVVSDRLLEEHPSGPIFGIPRNVIEDSQRNQRLTRKALGGLECEGER